MKKELTAITIATLLSSILIPTIATIKGIERLDGEVMRLPYDYSSLAQFSNLCIIAIITGLILYCLNYLLYFKPLKKFYVVGIYIFTWFLSLIEFFCLTKFELSISKPMISIMGDTNNMSEVRSFFELYFDWTTVVLILAMVLLAWAIWHFAEKICDFIIEYKKSFIAIFILLIIFAVTGHKIGGNSANAPIMKTIYSLNHGAKVKRYIAKLAANNTNKVEIISDKSDTPCFIFVIGEAESRLVMGLYNKKYDSTPLCQKLVDSGNMFAFTNTISMKSVTALCIPPLLSFMENTNTTPDLTKFDSILDVFAKANYQTFWISNHEKITKDMSYATVLMMKSDYNAHVAKVEGCSEYVPWLCQKDEAVLKPLDEFIQNKVPQKEKNFFVIHIMGSHARYVDRYPESFNHFKSSDIKENGFNDSQKDVYAKYLNSVYYTDYVLNEIISRFKEQNAVLVYVPDHGEELWQGGFVGHGPTNVSKYMVEIPMLIWLSDKYKENNPSIVENIKSSLDKPFMTDNLVHVILDLAKIQTKQYDATKSVINPAFVARDRIVTNGLKYEELRK